ncbi:MAG: hypothetical protein JWR35_1329 [Marmoricola sp.]|nr:hypothetical protein [Marmoricola sp.]
MSERDSEYPESAEPPEATGRDRLRASVFKPSRGQTVVAILLAVLGFAMVLQARETGSDDTYAGLRQDELIQALNGLSAASRRAENDINSLERTRSSLQNNSEKRTAALAQAQKEVTTLGILAGTIPTTGPGIRITITDPGHMLTINSLLDGIEELRDAGAEAMEINDSVRVIAQTSFEDGSGGGIIVDGKLLNSPYSIDAIGDPETLDKALDFTGGFNDEIQSLGGGVKVSDKRLDKVGITVVRTPVAPQYAHTVQ